MTSDRATGWLLVAAQFLLLAALVFLANGGAWGVPPWLRASGTVLRGLGVAAIAWGGLQLGRAASVHPEPTGAAVLRVDGAYRWVRHPIYAGVLVLGVSIAATSASAAKVLVALALTMVLNAKARSEERLLACRFPAYPDYAARTPRFVPRLARVRHKEP